MKFSIITPSFRNSEWLKFCIASVADQDIEHEHIVQDSCSNDGTEEWLPSDQRVKAFIEKDRGMYDAVNRGFRSAQGECLAYINCDEQYLPGALQKVAKFFDTHPETDVVFADAVVVAADGSYLCDRKAITPQKAHTMVGGSMSFLTCSTFMRRQAIIEGGLFFNDTLRDLGDGDWAVKLVEKRVPMGVLREFTTAFTETGANMNLLPNAHREKQEFYQRAWWARWFQPWCSRTFDYAAYWRRLHHVSYQYSIHTRNGGQRQTFHGPADMWLRPALRLSMQGPPRGLNHGSQRGNRTTEVEIKPARYCLSKTAPVSETLSSRALAGTGISAVLPPGQRIQI
jgi:glycosyltransferase involved in cell wall biosynthesis